MNVIYIQDQEIYSFKNRYFHPKSEHFFLRYLEGLDNNDKLTVYTGVIEINNDDLELINKYNEVTHPRIVYKKVPEFRKISNLHQLLKIIHKAVVGADFCFLRCGVASSMAGYLCCRHRIPYMAIVNEDIYKSNISHPSLLVKISALPLYYCTRKIVKKANYTCYVTQNYLQRRYPSNGKTLGCSDIEYLEYDDSIINRRTKNATNKKSPIVLGSVGNVNAKVKGYDTAIKALALIKKEGKKEFRYQLVGSGNQALLKKLAIKYNVDDWIVFLGEYSHDSVLKWLETIDIYIHPSRSEGLPRAILEAMTKATPCICSSVGGIPELIKEDCLFSYDGHEIMRLKEIICNMSEENMKEEILRNYKKSKEYNPIELEKIRRQFFIEVIQSIKSREI